MLLTLCCRTVSLCRYLLAEKDMEYNQAALKMAAEHTTFFQYIYQNGPESLFKGYVWTLDVYVDFAWAQFGSLSIALIILLSLELGVQILCTMYELFILNMANAEGMKHCSVFLALPSATIRSVASRQLQVKEPMVLHQHNHVSYSLVPLTVCNLLNKNNPRRCS